MNTSLFSPRTPSKAADRDVIRGQMRRHQRAAFLAGIRGDFLDSAHERRIAREQRRLLNWICTARRESDRA